MTSARLLVLPLLLIAAACRAQNGLSLEAAPFEVQPEEVGRLLADLSADSMQGRATATVGEERAARYIAARLRELGVEAAGDSGFIQPVPLRVVMRANGRRALDPLTTWEAWQALPAAERATGRNVVGIIRGTSSGSAEEGVIIGAHYDHLGIGRPVAGDSIYNGADDDASGVVTVLEIARALSAGERPERSVIFLLSTGEEIGMLGTNWYLDHPVVPLERTAGGLFVEMIGRPDPLAGGAGGVWLTGYDRSTMGAMLAAAGIPIIPDPRPDQNFFERSDNTPFARRGVPAHVLSSYNLHSDYHTPDDELAGADTEHMSEAIETAAGAARVLVSGPAPVWSDGGRPR